MPPPIDFDEVRRRLLPKPVGEVELAKLDELRARALDLGAAIADLCPEGREKSLALTALEDTVMRATRAVTHEG